MSVLAVVLLHVAAHGVTSQGVGTLPWWIANAADSAVRWCMPVLVMISGALLLHSDRHSEPALVLYRKRLRRVLLPLLGWTLVYSLWNQRGMDLNAGERLAHALEGIGRGAPHYHLWFLYMITVLYMFVPLLRALVAAASRRVLTLLAVAGFVLAAWAELQGSLRGAPVLRHPLVFLGFLPYFIAGHLLATAHTLPRQRTLWAGAAVSMLATAVGCFMLSRAHGIEAGLYFYAYLSLTVIPMSLAAAALLRSVPLPGTGSLRRLAPLTLGIYLVHPLLLELANADILLRAGVWPGVVLPMLTLVLFVASAGIAAALTRIPGVRGLV